MPDEPTNWWWHVEWLEREFAREERLDLKDELRKVATERANQNRGPIFKYHQRMVEMGLEVEELSGVTRPALVKMRKELAGSLRQKRNQWIYIAQYGEVVKVGVSVQPTARVKAHEKYTGHPTDMIAVFRGDETVETAICRSFADHTAEGREWFHAVPVADIARGYKLPAELNEMLLWDKPAPDWPVIRFDNRDRKIMMGFGLVGKALND